MWSMTGSEGKKTNNLLQLGDIKCNSQVKASYDLSRKKVSIYHVINVKETI